MPNSKWPNTLTLVRHNVSAYNALKLRKQSDPTYQKFTEAFKADPDSEETKKLALQIKDKFSLEEGDWNTPLHAEELWRAKLTGQKMKADVPLPDVIHVSPYVRTLETLDGLTEGWPELKNVVRYEEERVREQEHGLSILPNDWMVFAALYPEQRILREKDGPYWYRFPQGENVPDVRARNHS